MQTENRLIPEVDMMIKDKEIWCDSSGLPDPYSNGDYQDNNWQSFFDENKELKSNPYLGISLEHPETLISDKAIDKLKFKQNITSFDFTLEE